MPNQHHSRPGEQGAELNLSNNRIAYFQFQVGFLFVMDDALTSVHMPLPSFNPDIKRRFLDRA